MQLVNVKIKDNKNEIKYIDFVVASTKSKNNYYENLENNDICVYSRTEQVKELYLDRETAKELGEIASKKIGIDIVDNVINALEIACIVKRQETKK